MRFMIEDENEKTLTLQAISCDAPSLQTEFEILQEYYCRGTEKQFSAICDTVIPIARPRYTHNFLISVTNQECQSIKEK